MPSCTVRCCAMIELFEHNKSAYETALALLEETNRTCVIHPWAPASLLLRSNG